MAKAKFIGVYASSRVPSVRSQSAASHQKRYWFAWEDGWGRFRVQLLDAAFQPLDAPRVISAAEFKEYFVHQPRILVTPVTQLEVAPPEPQEEAEAFPSRLSSAKSPREPAPEALRSSLRGAPDSAPDAFPEAARAVDNERTATRQFRNAPPLRDEEPFSQHSNLEQAERLDKELRNEFAVALARWQRGDRVTPLKVFENMCKREEGIIPAHKHMFTDFAIDLRKSRLPALATRHYQKAVELAPEDSNAHFNLARIYFETGRFDKAEEHLCVALSLTPEFELASRFLRYLREQQTLSMRASSDKKTRRFFS